MINTTQLLRERVIDKATSRLVKYLPVAAVLSLSFVLQGKVEGQRIMSPQIVYSTYLGGGRRPLFHGGFGQNHGADIAIDKEGYIYVTGRTMAVDFPTVKPLQKEYGGGENDAFVAKLRPDGQSFVYCTYLGGKDVDFGNRIAVDEAGCAYVVGTTYSSSFPTTERSFQRSYGGGDRDGFVCKLSADGSKLLYSTLIGGSATDRCQAIALDREGNAYVTGSTSSINFPAVHLLRPKPAAEDWDAFVVKLNADGSKLEFATRFGGTAGVAPKSGGFGGEGGSGIAVDSAGNVYVTGSTDSPDFVTVNPLQSKLLGLGDAFLAKLNPDGSQLLFSTFLGGSLLDIGGTIVLDKGGDIYVTGYTSSADFPVKGAIQTYSGKHDISFNSFVAKLKPDGQEIVYSTYLGGDFRDSAYSIAVNSEGNAVVVGRTQSRNFPVVNALQNTLANPVINSADAFITQINPQGSALLFSTFLGGQGEDEAAGVSVDRFGDIYIIGSTGYGDKSDFPVVRAVQPKRGGPTTNVFITKISSQPIHN